MSFTLTGDDLAYYDTRRAAWVADPGSYTVAIGASSRDIRQRASFDVARERVVRQVQNRLTPEVEMDELRPGGP